jgi:hypothetical protein
MLAAAAVVCLALLALLAVAQVAHTHTARTDADHCQLCLVMHSVVPAAAAAALLVQVPVAAFSPVVKRVPLPIRRQNRLYSRPPPVR